MAGKSDTKDSLILPSAFHSGFVFSSGAVGTDIDTSGAWTFDSIHSKTKLVYDFNNWNTRHTFLLDYTPGAGRLYYSESKCLPIGNPQGPIKIRENEIQGFSFPAEHRNFTCVKCTVYTLPSSFKFPDPSLLSKGFSRTTGGFDPRKIRYPWAPLTNSAEQTLSVKTASFVWANGEEPVYVTSYLDERGNPSGELVFLGLDGSGWDFVGFRDMSDLSSEELERDEKMSDGMEPPECPCAFGNAIEDQVIKVLQKYIPFPLQANT